jgi:hypothetical protein
VARELFVYWRATLADARRAETAAAQLQAALRERHPGLVARLYRRTDSEADIATLMETYTHPAGIDQALQAAIDDAAGRALGTWCIGTRHVEVFEAIVP